jgi:hypothetical protein
MPARSFVVGQVWVAERAAGGGAQLLSVEAVVACNVGVLVPVGMQSCGVLVAHRVTGCPQLIENLVEVDGVPQGDAIGDQAQRAELILHPGVICLAPLAFAASIDPATTPPLVAHVGDAYIAAQQGVIHYTLAMASGDPSAAERAVPLLRHAVDHLGPDYARPRALYLPDLAGAHPIAGDTDTAITLGHQAVDAVTTVSSPRAYDRLRVLNTALEPLHTSAGVAELHNRLTTTAV